MWQVFDSSKTAGNIFLELFFIISSERFFFFFEREREREYSARRRKTLMESLLEGSYGIWLLPRGLVLVQTSEASVRLPIIKLQGQRPFGKRKRRRMIGYNCC